MSARVRREECGTIGRGRFISSTAFASMRALSIDPGPRAYGRSSARLKSPRAPRCRAEERSMRPCDFNHTSCYRQRRRGVTPADLGGQAVARRRGSVRPRQSWHTAGPARMLRTRGSFQRARSTVGSTGTGNRKRCRCRGRRPQCGKRGSRSRSGRHSGTNPRRRTRNGSCSRVGREKIRTRIRWTAGWRRGRWS